KIEAIGFFWSGNAGYVFGEAPAPDNLPGVVPPTMYRADPEQCGGGYTIDGVTHLVSEILWVTDQRAKRVSCIVDKLPSDRRGAFVMELESGAIVTISALGDSDS